MVKLLERDPRVMLRALRLTRRASLRMRQDRRCPKKVQLGVNSVDRKVAGPTGSKCAASDELRTRTTCCNSTSQRLQSLAVHLWSMTEPVTVPVALEGKEIIRQANPAAILICQRIRMKITRKIESKKRKMQSWSGVLTAMISSTSTKKHGCETKKTRSWNLGSIHRIKEYQRVSRRMPTYLSRSHSAVKSRAQEILMRKSHKLAWIRASDFTSLTF